MAIKVSKETGGKKQTFNEINITPLTDIFLVLLIIMMVIAHSLQSIVNNINMPEITLVTGNEKLKAYTTVTKKEEIFIHSETINKDKFTYKHANYVQ